MRDSIPVWLTFLFMVVTFALGVIFKALIDLRIRRREIIDELSKPARGPSIPATGFYKAILGFNEAVGIDGPDTIEEFNKLNYWEKDIIIVKALNRITAYARINLESLDELRLKFAAADKLQTLEDGLDEGVGEAFRRLKNYFTSLEVDVHEECEAAFIITQSYDENLFHAAVAVFDRRPDYDPYVKYREHHDKDMVKAINSVLARHTDDYAKLDQSPDNDNEA